MLDSKMYFIQCDTLWAGQGSMVKESKFEALLYFSADVIIQTTYEVIQ